MTEIGKAAPRNRHIGHIWRVAEALEYGILGINEGIIWTEIAPFTETASRTSPGHIWLT
jgi:succinate-semialdehyde dehydrogenase/glutarate-semialdehyde dehydrogenase